MSDVVNSLTGFQLHGVHSRPQKQGDCFTDKTPINNFLGRSMPVKITLRRRIPGFFSPEKKRASKNISNAL